MSPDPKAGDPDVLSGELGVTVEATEHMLESGDAMYSQVTLFGNAALTRGRP